MTILVGLVVLTVLRGITWYLLQKYHYYRKGLIDICCVSDIAIWILNNDSDYKKFETIMHTVQDADL